MTGSIHKGSGVGGGQNAAVGVAVGIGGIGLGLDLVFVGKMIGGNVLVAWGAAEIVGEAVKVDVSVGDTVAEFVGTFVFVGC